MEQYNFYGPSGGLSIKEEDGKITLSIIPADHAFIKDVQFKLSNSAAKEVVNVLQKIVDRTENPPKE